MCYGFSAPDLSFGNKGIGIRKFRVCHWQRRLLPVRPRKALCLPLILHIIHLLEEDGEKWG